MVLDLNRWNLAIFHGMLSESLDVQLIANTCCCVKSLQAKLTSGGNNVGKGKTRSLHTSPRQVLDDNR